MSRTYFFVLNLPGVKVTLSTISLSVPTTSLAGALTQYRVAAIFSLGFSNSLAFDFKVLLALP